MVLIIELGAEETEGSVAALKDEGNAAFSSKDYTRAVQLYTQAFDLFQGGEDADGEVEAGSVLLSNRAACHLLLKDWPQALSDASAAVGLNAFNGKAYHRKATAQRRAGDRAGAEATLRTGIATVPPASAAPLESALKDLLQKTGSKGGTNKISSGGSSSSSSKGEKDAKRGGGGGFLLKKGKGLFGDSPATAPLHTPGNETERILGRLRAAVAAGVGGAGVLGSGSNNDERAAFEGVFKKLLDKATFQRTVFPGLTEEQRQGCPQTFTELLSTDNGGGLYAQALEQEAVPEAQAKAKSVMDNVKRKGALVGDVMDAQTEGALMPQVLNEAFARAVIKVVQRVHKRQHQVLAKDPRLEARAPPQAAPPQAAPAQAQAPAGGGGGDVSSALKQGRTGGSEREGDDGDGVDDEEDEDCPPWELEQLEGSGAVEGGLAGPLACCSVDGFMGEDWADLALEDVLRLVVAASPSASSSSIPDAATSVVKDRMQPLPMPERGHVQSDSNSGGKAGTVSESLSASMSASASSSSSSSSSFSGPLSHGEMLWLPDSPDALKAEYPALAEVVSCMHALPFELNRAFDKLTAPSPTTPTPTLTPCGDEEEGEKDQLTQHKTSPSSLSYLLPPPAAAATAAAGPADASAHPLSSSAPPLSSVRLTIALPSSTALIRLKPGALQPPRLDCQALLQTNGIKGSSSGSGGSGSRSGNDSGQRITALYFLPPKLSLEAAAALTVGKAKGDDGGGGDAAGDGETTTTTTKGLFGGDLVLRLLPTTAATADQTTPTAANLTTTTTTTYGAVGDRLVLWRSDVVLNERTLCRPAEAKEKSTTDCSGGGRSASGENESGGGGESTAVLYAIAFWMHGAERA